MMSPSYSSDGYRRVIFRVNKKEKSRTVHSLVIEAFRGPRLIGMVINHLNYDRADNNLANLEYITREGNIRYSHKGGRYLRTGPYKDDRFTAEDVHLIRSGKFTDEELSIKFNAARSFINKIRRRVSYVWVG